MGLKSFDFFRKIQTEQELSSTIGGIFTIFSLIVAATLIYLSVQDFTRIGYITTLAVKNDPNEYLPMNIDIIFNKVPCELLAISFHDQLEYVEKQVERKLNMTVMQGDISAPYTHSDNREELKKRAEQGIQKKKQCRVSGILNLPKTPGIIRFETTGKDNLQMLMAVDKRSQIRASYYLTKLQFGNSPSNFQFPISHSSPMLGNYIQNLQGSISSRTFIQDFRNDTNRLNYYNHLKVIPIYVNEQSNEKDRQKYRYSLRAGSAYSTTTSPMLEINTEIEPINIVYTPQKMTYYDLSVDILAIVGGSVATIGVLNSISHFFMGLGR